MDFNTKTENQFASIKASSYENDSPARVNDIGTNSQASVEPSIAASQPAQRDKDLVIKQLKAKIVQIVSTMQQVSDLNLQQQEELKDVYAEKQQFESIIQQQKSQITKLNAQMEENQKVQEKSSEKSEKSSKSSVVKKEGLSNLQLDLVKAYGEKANLRQENDNLKQELEKQKSLQKDNMLQNQKVGDLLNQVAQLKQQNEELDIGNHSLQKQIDSLQELNIILQEKNDELGDHKATAKKKGDADKQQKADELRQSVASSKRLTNKEKESLTLQIEQLEQDNNRKTQQMNEVIQENGILKSKLQEFENQIENAGAKQKQNNKEIQDQTAVISKMKDENQKLVNMVNSLQEAANESFADKRENDLQQIRFLEKEKEALKSQILDASQRQQESNIEKAELEQKLENMQESLPLMENEIIRMKASFEAQINSMKDQNDQMNGLSAMNNQLTEQLKNLEAKDEANNQMSATLMEKVKTLKEQNEQLKAQSVVEQQVFQEKYQRLEQASQQHIQTQNQEIQSASELKALQREQDYQQLLIAHQQDAQNLAESTEMVQKLKVLLSEQTNARDEMQQSRVMDEHKELEMTEKQEQLTSMIHQQKQKIDGQDKEIEQLKSTAHQQTTYMNQLQADNDRLVAQLNNKSKSDEMKPQQAILKNEKDMMQDKYLDTVQQMQQLLMSNQELETLVNDLKTQKSEMADKNAKQKEQMNTLQRQMTDMQGQFQPLNDQVNSLYTMIETQKQKLSSLGAELEDEKEQNATSTSLIQQQQAKIEELLNKNRIQTREMGQKEEADEAAKIDLQEKANQYDELSQIFEELRKQHQAELVKTVSLENQIAGQQSQYEEANNMLEEQQKLTASLRKEIEDSENKYDNLSSILQSLQQKVGDDAPLRAELEENVLIIQELKKQKPEFEAKIETYGKEIQNLNRRIVELEQEIEIEEQKHQEEVKRITDQFNEMFKQVNHKKETQEFKNKSLTDLIDTLQTVNDQNDYIKQSQSFEKKSNDDRFKVLLENKQQEILDLKNQLAEMSELNELTKTELKKKQISFDEQNKFYQKAMKDDQEQFTAAVARQEAIHRTQIDNVHRENQTSLDNAQNDSFIRQSQTENENLSAELQVQSRQYKQQIQQMKIKQFNFENEKEQVQLEQEMNQKKHDAMEEQLKAQKDLDEKLLEKIQILELEVKQIDQLKQQHEREMDQINSKYSKEIDLQASHAKEIEQVESKLTKRIKDLENDLTVQQERYDDEKSKVEQLEQRYETQFEINKKNKVIIHDKTFELEARTQQYDKVKEKYETLTIEMQEQEVRLDEKKTKISKQNKMLKALANQLQEKEEERQALQDKFDQSLNNVTTGNIKYNEYKSKHVKETQELEERIHELELNKKDKEFEIQRSAQKVVEHEDKIAFLTKEKKEQHNAFSIEIAELKDNHDSTVHQLKQATANEVAQLRKQQHIEINQIRAENQEFHVKMKQNDKEILQVKEKKYMQENEAELARTKVAQAHSDKVYQLQSQMNALASSADQNLQTKLQVEAKNSQLASIVDDLNSQVLQVKMQMNNEMNNVKNNIATMRTMLSKTIVEVKDGSKASNALLHVNINLQKLVEKVDSIEIKEHKPTNKLSDLVVGTNSDQQLQILNLEKQLKAYQQGTVNPRVRESGDSVYQGQKQEIKEHFNNEMNFTNDQHQKVLVQNLKQLLVEKETELGRAKKEATYLRLQNQDANVISDLENKIKKHYESYTVKSQQVQALEEQVTSLKIELKTKNELLEQVKPKFQSKEGSLHQASEKIQHLQQSIIILEKEQITSLRKLEEKDTEMLHKETMIQKYQSTIKNIKMRVIKLLYIHLNRNGSIEDVIQEMETSKDFGNDGAQQQLTIPAIRNSMGQNSVNESQNTQVTSQYKYRSANKAGAMSDREKEIQLHTQRIQQLERLNKSFDNNPQDRSSNEFSHDRLPPVISSQKFQRRNNSQDLRLQPIDGRTYSNNQNPYGLVNIKTNPSQKKYETIDDSVYGNTPVQKRKTSNSPPKRAQQNNFVRKQATKRIR